MKLTKEERKYLKEEADPLKRRAFKGHKIFELTLNPVEGDPTKVEGSLEGGFVVTNSKGEKHEVSLISEYEGTCDCKDYLINLRRKGNCKHVYASMELNEYQQQRPPESEESIELNSIELI